MSSRNESWPWLFEPRPSCPAEVTKAHDSLIASEEALTDLDFTEKWEGRATECIVVEDGVAKNRPDENPDGPNIEIDYNKKSLKLPDFVAKALSIDANVDGTSVRYAGLSTDYAQGGRVVMVSLWADVTQTPRSINNVYLVTADVEQALLLVSAILRLVYEVSDKNVIRTHKFSVMLYGPVDVIKCTPAERDIVDKQRDAQRKREEEAFMAIRADGTESSDDEENPKPKPVKVPREPDLVLPHKSVHYILDEESLGLYDDEFSLKPWIDLRFYKEVSDHSIESIFVNNLTGYLEAQQGEVVCIISPSTVKASECFRELTTLLKKRGIMPKAADIFTDATKFSEFITESHTEAEKPAATSSQARLQPATGSFQSQGPSTSEDASWLNNLITGEHLTNCNEEMQVIWFAAESDLTAVIRDGKIPDSRIESSGLDPKSQEHLMKVLESIKEELYKNSYAIALSQLQGCRRVFGETLLREVNRLDDIELLKRIFLLQQ